MHITVVGAGVIGLTTALTLEEHGHRVHIVAAETGAATTSAVAGAIWFPYKCGPVSKVPAWAQRTRAWLESLAGERAAGIDVLTGYEITADDTPPWWAAGIAVVRAPAPVAGSPMAWRYTAPRVEPARFLPWLARNVRATITRRTVTDLAAEPGDAVINCSGLGARTLAADPSVIGLLGQIAIAAPGKVDLGVTVTDDRDPDGIFYVIPRRDELVLGGCAIPASAIAIDPARTARILAQARALGLPIGEVRVERAGLRPYRAEVRLERDPANPRIIHAYGHGGAGFTLARGCAEDVVQILMTPP